MKANEAKSKFVYPDKLYARCKDNKTLDISYAPQTLEAVEYVRTDAFIEKAVNYLDYKLSDIVKVRQAGTIIEAAMVKPEFVEDFKKAMEL